MMVSIEVARKMSMETSSITKKDGSTVTSGKYAIHWRPDSTVKEPYQFAEVREVSARIK